MNWPSDASNWLDVLDHGLVILGAIILAAVPSVFSARNHLVGKRNSATLDEIKGSVINGHGDKPLREDVDRVIAEVGKMAAAVDRMAQVVSEIREDAADERTTRRTEIRELREDMDTRLTQLNRRLP